jgi:type 1 glutamine amidotransferase
LQRSIGILAWRLCFLALPGCAPAAPPAEQSCAAVGDDGAPAAGQDADGGGQAAFDILLYTYSTGYRHVSIPDGINAIRALGAANGFGVVVQGTRADARGSYCTNEAAPADPGTFTAASLSRYAAVVFLSTTTAADGSLLDEAGKAAFEAYIRAGGGFVGVHAAADAEYGWAFYHDLLGATFLGHGPPVTASLHVEDGAHPATRGLPDPWSRYDEWYDFTTNPRATSHVLVDLDETTYPNNPYPMGDHPIAWCKTVDAGRSFYTALAHTGAAFADPLVRQHLLGGIRYAASAAPGDCSF